MQRVLRQYPPNCVISSFDKNVLQMAGNILYYEGICERHTG
jgi:hypothetical protein